jgi:hypothetical protein
LQGFVFGEKTRDYQAQKQPDSTLLFITCLLIRHFKKRATSATPLQINIKSRSFCIKNEVGRTYAQQPWLLTAYHERVNGVNPF